MEKQEYYSIHRLEKTHWWFVGKRKIFLFFWKKFVSGNRSKDIKILDIGCGDGSYIKTINKIGYKNTYGVDFANEAIGFCKEKRVKNIRLHNMENGLPFFENNFFDVVVMLDSLEHIKNENKILEEINRILKPGGVILINVPAHQFLWSHHDEYLHHQRRYSKKYFTKKMNDHNFKIKRLTFTNFFIFLPGFLIILLKRYITKSKVIADTQEINVVLNPILKLLYDMEIFLLHFANFPFGFSLFAVVKKLNDQKEKHH